MRSMVFQKRPPSLTLVRVSLGVSHVFGDSVIADRIAQFRQFTLNPLSRPERIFSLKFADEFDERPVNSRAADLSGLPCPVIFEAFPMPVDRRLGLNDNQGRFPIVPDSRQPNPEQAIGFVDLWPFDTTLLNDQLLTKGHVFKNQFSPTPKQRSQKSTDDAVEYLQMCFLPD